MGAKVTLVWGFDVNYPRGRYMVKIREDTNQGKSSFNSLSRKIVKGRKKNAIQWISVFIWLTKPMKLLLW